MCNLDKIYALIVLECVAHPERPLKSKANDFQGEMADKPKGGFRKYRPVLESAYQAVIGGRAQFGSDGTSRSRGPYSSPVLEVQ